MQVRHFYEDALPSVRNPLNSIALSPDSISFNSCGIQRLQEDFGDFQSMMPSLNSCLLHGEGKCRKPAWLKGWFRRRGERRKNENDCRRLRSGVK